MLYYDPAFPAPDPEAKIWRFMSLAELVSLFSKQELFFSRVDKFDDPYEGSLPRLVQMQAENGLDKLTPQGQELIRDVRQHSGYVQSKLWTMVNCWYVNSHESVAMWKLHASEGVAIQSTFQRFVDAIKPSELKIFVGLVKYIDYETESWDLDKYPQTIMRTFHKRKSFEHESELRAVIDYPRPGGVYSVAEGPGYLDSAGLPGIFVGVGLAQLIENIRVSPGSPPWFKDVVKTIAGLAKLEGTVFQSKLDEDPLW